MHNINVFIVILMVAALLVAVFGFVQIIMKDKTAGKRSNNLMILRVVLQGAVIIIIALLYFFKGRV
jgi:hypothetical protein